MDIPRARAERVQRAPLVHRGRARRAAAQAGSAPAAVIGPPETVVRSTTVRRRGAAPSRLSAVDVRNPSDRQREPCSEHGQYPRRGSRGPLPASGSGGGSSQQAAGEHARVRRRIQRLPQARQVGQHPAAEIHPSRKGWTLASPATTAYRSEMKRPPSSANASAVSVWPDSGQPQTPSPDRPARPPSRALRPRRDREP